MSRASLKKRRKKKSGLLIHGHLIHVRYMEAVPKRAALVAQHLRTLNGVFATLLSDENFVTLLRAESMMGVPACFHPLLKEEKA
jgi:hypothetical protein